MAKITDQPGLNAPQADKNTAQPAASHNAQFSDILTQSRVLADKLTVHKAGGPFSMPVSPVSEAANNDTMTDHTPSSENLMEIGVSIATLVGRLSVLRATKK